MPEGPELARSRDFLRSTIVGEQLFSFRAVGGRYSLHPIFKQPEGLDRLVATLARTPVLIEEVGVKGKFMWWRMQPMMRDDEIEPWFVWCTYGMSGMWTTEPLDKHTAAIVTYGPFQHVIQFHDQRHFGTLKFVRGEEALRAKLASLGPDMLNDPPDELKFRQALLRRHSCTLAEVLMDQSVVSGVGNYVKAEALYEAELSPHREVRDLSTVELERLRRAITNVMLVSYRSGGATIATYRQGNGEPGKTQARFACYGRKEDVYGRKIVKEQTKDQRTTWWCPDVQR